jgi:hypothetical protein
MIRNMGSVFSHGKTASNMRDNGSMVNSMAKASSPCREVKSVRANGRTANGSNGLNETLLIHIMIHHSFLTKYVLRNLIYQS